MYGNRRQQTPARHPLIQYKSSTTWRLHHIPQVEGWVSRLPTVTSDTNHKPQVILPVLLTSQLLMGVCTILFSGSINLLKENTCVVIKIIRRIGWALWEGHRVSMPSLGPPSRNLHVSAVRSSPNPVLFGIYGDFIAYIKHWQSCRNVIGQKWYDLLGDWEASLGSIASPQLWSRVPSDMGV